MKLPQLITRRRAKWMAIPAVIVAVVVLTGPDLFEEGWLIRAIVVVWIVAACYLFAIAQRHEPREIIHCWNCRYDVEDSLQRANLICPECGSPLDELAERTVTHRNRTLLRRAAYSSMGGFAMVAVSQYETADYGFPSGPAATVSIIGATAAFGLGLHCLDRRWWPLDRSHPAMKASCALRTIGAWVLGFLVTGALLLLIVAAKVAFAMLTGRQS